MREFGKTTPDTQQVNAVMITPHRPSSYMNAEDFYCCFFT